MIPGSAGSSTRSSSSSDSSPSSGGSSATRSENLQRANIASGFGFLRGRAGFDISQTLIAYTSNSTVSRALLVGFLNTLLVAVTGIITASIIGFLVGIGRLSHNWLIRKISTVYVEIFRNIPPLLVIFFWYLGVLSVLPQPRDSYHLPFSSYLEQPRLLPAEAGLGRRIVADRAGLGAGHRHELVRGPPRAPAPDGDRPAVPGILDVAWH